MPGEPSHATQADAELGLEAKAQISLVVNESPILDMHFPHLLSQMSGGYRSKSRELTFIPLFLTFVLAKRRLRCRLASTPTHFTAFTASVDNGAKEPDGQPHRWQPQPLDGEVHVQRGSRQKRTSRNRTQEPASLKKQRYAIAHYHAQLDNPPPI